MSKERADLGFADALDDLDLSEFKPKPVKAANDRPSKAATAKAAEASGFKSREAKPVPDETAKPDMSIAEGVLVGQGADIAPKVPETIQQRRRRTGRNAQFNLKARPETIDAYCALADRMGWGLGETLERAVALLEKEYGKAG
jgi:hypothetical protein